MAHSKFWPIQLNYNADEPCFLSGSVQFFMFALLFLVSLIISSLWRGQWWGIFQLCCCCLFSTIAYSLCLNVSDQVRAGTAPARGRGIAQYALREGGGLPAAYLWEWLTLLRHSPWLWLVLLSRGQWILANQIRVFTQLTCILFHCQIVMTILSYIAKKIQNTALKIMLMYKLSPSWRQRF